MIVFENRHLIPREWEEPAAAGPVRVFNPGLLRDGDGWILAYRVVFESDRLRRIAMCRLDDRWNVVDGSAAPYSDAITFPTPDTFARQALTWFADPRLYRFGSRTYVYWNSGWHEPSNHQFLQEFDRAILRPCGPPRPLELVGTRQQLEKNWALFESNGDVYAVYTVNPHRVLRVALAGEGPIHCAPIDDFGIPNPGGFAQAHGGLRGGAPPFRCGDTFYSFCHTIENAPDGFSYVAAAYQFSAKAPFSPVAMPARPLRIEPPAMARRQHQKLNAAVGSVLYPSGAAYMDGRWVISLGIDDERCALAFVEKAEVDGALRAVDVGT